MKAIIGVDEGGSYKSALCLLGRFRSPGLECVLEHVLSPVPFLGPPHLVDPNTAQSYIAAAETAGRQILDLSLDEACNRDMKAKKRLVAGSAASALVADADALDADLVAVTATHSGRWAQGFTGSVSQALIISAKCSVLIAKGEFNPGAPVKVVVATDLSDKSIESVRELIRYRARGISQIHVVSAVHVSDHEKRVLARIAPHLDYKQVWKDAENKCEALADEFAEAGIPSTWSVLEGNPNDVIRTTMQNQGADLLAIGAQGKGFVERLLLGSTSLHQVICEPYPVLVLRPKAKH